MPEKKSKPSARADREALPQGRGKDTRNPAASSRRVKSKTKTDAKLIKKLFGIDALDWARYPDGRLVVIGPSGAKDTYTEQQLDQLIAASKPSTSVDREALPQGRGKDPRNTRASSCKVKRNPSKITPEAEAKPKPEPKPESAGAPASQPSASAEGGDPGPRAASSRAGKG